MKNYASKQSLSNHTKRFHKNTDIVSGINQPIKPNKYNCRYCKSVYKHIQSRWKHEKNCKIIFEENERIKKELIKQKEQIKDLKQKLLNTKRIDNKTFKELNKLLMERSINVTNNSISITNNYQIVSFGEEDMVKSLTTDQKKQILDCRFNSLEKLVEITHCGDFNQFKNIIITNLKDNYAYKYDAEKGYFVTVQKNTLLDTLVTFRLGDIEAIYNELNEADLIDSKTKKVIQRFLDKMEDNSPIVEGDTKYENYKSYKIENIKILIYNNQADISKNIALLISEKCPHTEIQQELLENNFTQNEIP
jgi:hypothetical protein